MASKDPGTQAYTLEFPYIDSCTRIVGHTVWVLCLICLYSNLFLCFESGAKKKQKKQKLAWEKAAIKTTTR